MAKIKGKDREKEQMGMSECPKEDKKKWMKNEEAVLQIEDLGIDGEGIGHLDGYTVFVKGALPDESVKIRFMKVKKNYAYARLIQVLKPSSDRVIPFCESASPCGGCTLQHLTYERQLAVKEKRVKDCLVRIGKVEPETVEWLPILGMQDNPWHYRNKAQFPVRQGKDGTPVTGFFAGRSHHLIETSDCAIQHPDINKVMRCVMTFFRKYRISAYEEEKGIGLVRHIYIRRAYHTGEIQVCLVLNGRELPHSKELIEQLTELEDVTSLYINVNTQKTNVILGEEMKLLFGKSYIEDKIGSVRYHISPQSFYQVNPLQTERLYKTALDFAELQEKETVWDLYCGIGTISLFLAQSVSKGRVVGVEIIPEAIENAKENAQINHIENVDFYCGAAEEVVNTLLNEREEKTAEKADVVVVDPPRKGCDEKLLDTIAHMAPKRIVYVSCNPATLARDVAVLAEKGYQVEKVQPCDMFPQSTGIETVVKLGRKNAENDYCISNK